MRREFAVVCCAVVLLLAGCQGLGVGTEGTPPSGTDTPGEVTTLELRQANADAGTDCVVPEGASGDRPDPASDCLGWENGYWHNESLAVDNGDGLNDTELSAVVNRSMARVEYVRGLEFESSVPVSTVSRAAYRDRSGNGNYGDALRTFDNAKFEALFLVGEGNGSIETQERARGDSVLGYYSPARDEIVIVTNSETPRIGERTLGHELVHALQDQTFDIESDASTRDGVQGRNALFEGDARTTELAYVDRCGANWSCVTAGQSGGGGGGGGDLHLGVFYLQYFPYTDGTAFVADLRDRGGWDAVNDAYGDVPEGTREVITPADYPEWEPHSVTIPAPPSDDWERVRPSADRGRPDYATVGPSAIAAGMAYTVFDDYNESSVVTPARLFNYDGVRPDRADPYNYDLPGTSGWDGGRLHVYAKDGETGYVWRTVWTDERSAERFAAAWEQVVRHWGGERTAGGNWVIAEESPFTDAVAVHVEGDTVTVVNAPTEAELSELYDA
ncbi:Hvo_1808 family surface protein [Haloarcula onubensis]|uniref:Hvo_1808 family surface protein n=1 Tax=Haloarcula onubensis TaxID=2950539 RepID=A0ABU2FNU5_9EURY|nr:Hvo_1808 family surface protein [Halomicroarcula sp. S3CR25-11]MDS0281951.1 Hvo_1808 family surface protein [Halomicroarcula sp. S3CR25-11]